MISNHGGISSITSVFSGKRDTSASRRQNHAEKCTGISVRLLAERTLVNHSLGKGGMYLEICGCSARCKELTQSHAGPEMRIGGKTDKCQFGMQTEGIFPGFVWRHLTGNARVSF